MLSVFIAPWMKPTFIHCAISAAATAAPPRSSASGASGDAGELRVVARDRVVDRRRSVSRSPREAKNWKVPTRGWLAATRASAPRRAAVARSEPTSPVAATASARVVEYRARVMASPISTSRIGPMATLPSPPREEGVWPSP